MKILWGKQNKRTNEWLAWYNQDGAEPCCLPQYPLGPRETIYPAVPAVRRCSISLLHQLSPPASFSLAYAGSKAEKQVYCPGGRTAKEWEAVPFTCRLPLCVFDSPGNLSPAFGVVGMGLKVGSRAKQSLPWGEDSAHFLQASSFQCHGFSSSTYRATYTGCGARNRAGAVPI